MVIPLASFTAVYVHMEHLAGASASADSWQSKEDLFSSISNFSLQLQRNNVILPQAVSGIESLLATIEAMAASPKPDGKLSEFLAAMKKQRQQRGGEPGAGTFKYQEVTLSKGEAAERAEGQPINPVCSQTAKSHCADLGELSPTTHLHCPGTGMAAAKKGQRGVPTDENDDNTSFKDKSYLGLWQVMTTKSPTAQTLRISYAWSKSLLVLPISSAVCERGFCQ
ncbi:unnamed protein product [Gadus morhua 'NCC']